VTDRVHAREGRIFIQICIGAGFAHLAAGQVAGAQSRLCDPRQGKSLSADIFTEISEPRAMRWRKSRELSYELLNADTANALQAGLYA